MADASLRDGACLLQLEQLFLEVADFELDAFHEQVDLILEGRVEVALLQQPELIVFEIPYKLAETRLQMLLTVFGHNIPNYYDAIVKSISNGGQANEPAGSNDAKEEVGPEHRTLSIFQSTRLGAHKSPQVSAGLPTGLALTTQDMS